MIHPGGPGGKHSRRGPTPIVIHLGLEPRRMKGTHFDGRTWPVRLPHRYILLAWNTYVTFPNLCAKVANIIVDPVAKSHSNDSSWCVNCTLNFTHLRIAVSGLGLSNVIG